jgi:glycosyltransferase involved in cell wall biosynthesis
MEAWHYAIRIVIASHSLESHNDRRREKRDPGSDRSAKRMTPRVVFGMTLYNNAAYLGEATDSILAQTEGDFALVMLDDGSSDESEAIARGYERRDARVRYWRHNERQGMVPTWKEVFEIARREYPGTAYFAWASDHDRWDSRWLARMVAELDSYPDAVLVYPQTLRIDERGELTNKEPRAFDTSAVERQGERWRRFCWNGFGSGDMVYGLVRMRALEAAGIFRSVRQPDRLLIAQLTLDGQIRQVAEPLWSRRQSSIGSVTRQSMSLFAGATPPRFNWPPTLQHAIVLQRYGVRPSMIAAYIIASAWRAARKTEVSKSIGRGIDNLHFVKKVIKKGFNHAVYHTLVGARACAVCWRRVGRKIAYEILMFTHRTGLRGPTNPRRR